MLNKINVLHQKTMMNIGQKNKFVLAQKQQNVALKKRNVLSVFGGCVTN